MFEKDFETFVLGIPTFFKGLGRFGHTDLVTMNKETGDNPHISQKPYNLSLKHTTWIQKEIETLEMAGIIV